MQETAEPALASPKPVFSPVAEAQQKPGLCVADTFNNCEVSGEGAALKEAAAKKQKKKKKRKAQEVSSAGYLQTEQVFDSAVCFVCTGRGDSVNFPWPLDKGPRFIWF